MMQGASKQEQTGAKPQRVDEHISPRQPRRDRHAHIQSPDDFDAVGKRDRVLKGKVDGRGHVAQKQQHGLQNKGDGVCALFFQTYTADEQSDAKHAENSGNAEYARQ